MPKADRDVMIGAPAPEVTLQTLTGTSVSLADTLQGGQHLLLIFLRHLGWIPCRDHVAQVRSHYDQIKALNTDVVVVSFEGGQWAQAWLAETGAPFSLLLDPTREAYRAFGLKRSLLRSWGPKNLWYYTRALLKGRRFKGIGSDTAQLGGDFVIDAHGIVRLAHPSRDPTDRPPVAALLAVLEQLEDNPQEWNRDSVTP